MNENHHRFIFQPGVWLGEGNVTFSASPETLHFYTRWDIPTNDTSIVACKQVVEMKDHGESINNAFCFTILTPSTFEIQLTNDIIGTVRGKGIIDPRTLAWEFHAQEVLEGFEVYELQPDGSYLLHAEYASPEQYRTIINGKIWLKD